MVDAELAHLELLAEVDALLVRLTRWTQATPRWQPAETFKALVTRLSQRAELLRIRLETPLVVATLGGTGTGKSALVNALLGDEVVQTGRQRPTTTRPVLICRPALKPEMLGIDPGSVELCHRDLPALSDLVLIDCPDPDTTEPISPAAEPDRPDTNLDRLRKILPLCDVLLVTATQQKYRSGRVADELAAAATGARLVFVQTHADADEDVRDDWRQSLDDQYRTGHIFRVDSIAALANAQAARQPKGDFAALVDLLTRQLAGAAAARIRRANFLDLVDEMLAGCRRRIDEARPAVEQLESAIEQQRTRLSAKLAGQMRSELLSSRRQWENRLLGRTASRWGLSPFALVLRLFQGIGGLLGGALLYRARTPAQMALWGAVTGARSLQKRSRSRRADRAVDRAVAACWDRTELHAASIVLDGYAAEAGFDRPPATAASVADEADRAGAGFVADVSVELESVIARLAARHTGWFTRWSYELLLAIMLGWILYRLGRNFFYDSWLGSAELLGLDFYVQCAFWLLLWCLLLVWALCGRLRRGLRREIDRLAESWNNSSSAAGLFVDLEDDCRGVEHFRRELELVERHVAQLRRRLSLPEEKLGRRR